MEQEILEKFTELEAKLENIFISVEKTRKYFLWTLIITIAMIVLPFFGLLFVIPQFLSIYTSGLGI
jgi:hypothetical protein